MDSVMMNQLPELAIPRNRTFASVNKPPAPLSLEKRNPYISKWYVLFDSKNDQWISFQPKVGQTVYPCYACRDMFGSRNSFLDHVNRRGLLLKYRCGLCRRNMSFYNTCSFLLHARDHFAEYGGKIDLDYIEISSIPMEIAGFLPITNIPRLYDKEDTADNENIVRNVKFYKPFPNCIGKRVVHFQPYELLFFSSANENNNNNNNSIINNFKEVMVVKQVNEYIPKCIFIPIKTTSRNEINTYSNYENDSDAADSPNDTDSDIVCLDEDDSNLSTSKSMSSFTQKIQVKSLTSLLNKQQPDSDEEVLAATTQAQTQVQDKQFYFCYECGGQTISSLFNHFQEGNKPLIDHFKCKKCGLIATSACSLKAHIRIHDKKSPFVCPECGQVFKSWNELNDHMEFICFHTAKTVRFKCPAKKCGKIFAQTITFSSHFPLAHMKVRFACNVCNAYFASATDYDQHVKLEGHNTATSGNETVAKIHECTVCLVPAQDIKQHVLNHVQDKDNRMYVFICKYCRSYYRSKQTYGVHLLKCTKLLLNNQVKKEVQRIDSHSDLKCKVIKFCKPCYCKIQFHCAYKDIKRITSCCPQCSTPFSDNKPKSYCHDYEHTANPFVRKNVDACSFICVLCNETLTDIEGGRFNYSNHACKYKTAVVILNVDYNIAQQVNGLLEVAHHQQEETSPPPSIIITDTNKKKRKRLFNGSMKTKRRSSSDRLPDDILPAEPIIFDGEYKCRLCNFKEESRTVFHEHIQEHRDISTSYQCMECGECFVVKPSLLKHLQVFHLIEDLDLYMNQNQCFDKEAVRILEENMRMLPGEVNEPVAENQCKICRQFFSDTLELSKHFRVHGMAFLMKKIK